MKIRPRSSSGRRPYHVDDHLKPIYSAALTSYTRDLSSTLHSAAPPRSRHGVSSTWPTPFGVIERPGTKPELVPAAWGNSRGRGVPSSLKRVCASNSFVHHAREVAYPSPRRSKSYLKPQLKVGTLSPARSHLGYWTLNDARRNARSRLAISAALRPMTTDARSRRTSVCKGASAVGSLVVPEERPAPPTPPDNGAGGKTLSDPPSAEGTPLEMSIPDGCFSSLPSPTDRQSFMSNAFPLPGSDSELGSTPRGNRCRPLPKSSTTPSRRKRGRRELRPIRRPNLGSRGRGGASSQTGQSMPGEVENCRQPLL